MANIFSICNVSVMPLRSEPSHRAEQVSQLLFGEKAELMEVNSKDWARIRCAWDGYEGWCKKTQLTEVARRDYKKPTKYFTSTNQAKALFETGEMRLPLGAELPGFKGGKLWWMKEPCSFKGKKLNRAKVSRDLEQLQDYAIQFINAPYLWGGRSLSGIDCSGLSQMAYKMIDQQLPRDAWQQAEKGQLVEFLEAARCGDLAFFDDKEGKIVHVGMLLDKDRIIHATETSGKVVIDKIDLGGIVSVSLKKRTHNLRFVKRILP